MAFLDYTKPIPTPAPVTTGTTIQNYTDPLGDVWVAKNGVRGGNWYRARDVIYALYHRNATLTAVAATWTPFSFDGADSDAYAIVSNGIFTPPVPGLYELFQFLTFNPTATGQHCDLAFYDNTQAAYLAQGNIQSAQASWGVYVPILHKRVLTTAYAITTRLNCAAALAIQVGSGSTSGLYINYLGTG